MPWNTESVKLYRVEGVVGTIRFFSEKYGIPMKTIYARRKLGWTMEKSVTTPLRVNKKGSGGVNEQRAE